MGRSELTGEAPGASSRIASDVNQTPTTRVDPLRDLMALVSPADALSKAVAKLKVSASGFDDATSAFGTQKDTCAGRSGYATPPVHAPWAALGNGTASAQLANPWVGTPPASGNRRFGPGELQTPDSRVYARTPSNWGTPFPKRH